MVFEQILGTCGTFGHNQSHLLNYLECVSSSINVLFAYTFMHFGKHLLGFLGSQVFKEQLIEEPVIQAIID